MYFNGRWVPLDVMDTIFFLWAGAAVIILGALYWFCRGKAPKGTSAAEQGGRRKRRGARRQR
jgi:hypothetical protein